MCSFWKTEEKPKDDAKKCCEALEAKVATLASEILGIQQRLAALSKPVSAVIDRTLVDGAGGTKWIKYAITLSSEVPSTVLLLSDGMIGALSSGGSSSVLPIKPDVVASPNATVGYLIKMAANTSVFVCPDVTHCQVGQPISVTVIPDGGFSVSLGDKVC